MAKPLYKYRPALVTPEDLKETLVGRKEILKRLLKTLKEAPKSRGLQHFLLIGPRGAGKTHLLLLTYHTIKGNISWAGVPNLNRYWVPVLFAEEEYRITSLTELLLVALEEIWDETGWPDALEIKTQISRISIPGKEECEKILGFLKQKREKENKQFLLLLDNIHDILPHFTEEDQGRLREILMSQDIFMLIGAAPTIFDTVAQYDKPFYNFFEVLWLPEISQGEIEELIKRRLKMDEKEEHLKQFEQIRYRIKAIAHLTGGNPRLVLSLYEIFAEDRMLEVEKSLLSLLDGLTPYFQDRMKDIAIQQRKILDAIALLEGPSTPMEISRTARLQVNTTASQLARLKQGGYVRFIKEKGKKKVLYDVSDRLFRLWRQMSVEAGRRRLTIIVQFLEVWFSPEEMAERIIKVAGEMADALTKGKIERAKEMIEKLYYYQEATRVPSKTFAHGQRVWGLIEIGNLKEAEAEVEKLFKEAQKKEDKDLLALAFRERAILCDHKGEIKSEIVALTECLKLQPHDSHLWYNMGVAYDDLDEYEKAVKCYSEAIKINPDSHETWYNKGVAYANLNQYEKAIECYNKAVKIKPDMHQAWGNMGNAYLELNQYGNAIEYYKKVLKFKLGDEKAWGNIGIVYSKLGKHEKAIGYYKKVLKIKSDDEKAWSRMGNAYIRLGRYEKAVECYKEAYRITQNFKKVPLKKNIAKMLLLTKLVLSKKDALWGNVKKAMEHLKSVIPYLPEIPSKTMQESIGVYFKDLLAAHEIVFIESALKLLMKKGDKNLRQFLKPYDDAIRYYHTKDPAILNRLFPEIREIVEQIVAKLGRRGKSK